MMNLVSQISVANGEKWLWDQIGMVIILLVCIYFLGREYFKLRDKYDALIQSVIKIATLWEDKWSKDNDSDVESKKLLLEIHDLLKVIANKRNNKGDVI